jgi:hypothetical protein
VHRPEDLVPAAVVGNVVGHDVVSPSHKSLLRRRSRGSFREAAVGQPVR